MNNVFGIEDDLFNNYMDYNRTDLSTIERMEQTGPFDLIVYKKNGQSYHFNGYDHSMRRLPDCWDDMTNDWLSIDFRNRMRVAMQRKGMNQSDLSEVSGVSVGAINYYLNGKVSPSLDALFKLAKGLDCQISDFIYIDEEKRKRSWNKK